MAKVDIQPLIRGMLSYCIASIKGLGEHRESFLHLFNRSARTAGTKIALRFPRLFVCPHLSRAQYIASYVTMQLQYIAAFGGLQAKLQQMKVVLCCLTNVVGIRKDPGFLAYSY